MVLSLAIFLPAIALVIWRPRPLNEATAAALGAAAMLIAGVVSPGQTWQVLIANDNVLLFFLGLMLISSFADQAGFFEWCAFKAVKLARGKSLWLLGMIFALGALLTAFLSNDATALILTPIVFTLVTRLKLTALPFVFACAFVANTASMLLPVSNPINLLAVERFNITLGEYLKYLLVPSILAIAVMMLIFVWLFRKSLSRPCGSEMLQAPVKVDSYFLAVIAGLLIIAAGYLVVSIYGLPLFYPALGGAAMLLSLNLAFRRFNLKQVRSGISWHIFLFIIALAVLVKGLENGGVIQLLANGISDLASRGPLQALASVTFGTAIGSNLVNNWSMMMVSVSSLGTMAAQTGGFNKVLVYGAVMGGDIGPNLTILGSLSSMLWLVLLRKRGLDIHPVQYLKLGLIVTPPMLIIGVFCLYASSRIFG
jgi:arsenical pump membrane protein